MIKENLLEKKDYNHPVIITYIIILERRCKLIMLYYPQYISYKYKIYPNKIQKELISKTFGCCRKLYNLMLDHYNKYGNIGNSYTYYTKQYDYFKEVDSHSLNNVYMNFRKSVNNHMRNPIYFRSPKYKSKYNKQSYSSDCINNGIRIELVNNVYKVRLPKLGYITIRYHRYMPSYYKIKKATISKDIMDHYYISITLEYTCNSNTDNNQYNSNDTVNNTYNSNIIKYNPIININNILGIDYSITNLIVTSDIYLNNRINNNRYYKSELHRIQKLQYKLSRCKRYSKNYYRIKRKLSKIHIKIHNRRYDYLHKLSKYIINNYDIVCVEDIDIKDITANTKKYNLGKYIYDTGYGTLRYMINYKLDRLDKIMIVIDKYYPSSQICNICGYRNKELKDFSIKQYKCPICNTYHNRDYNAACNIRDEGKRIYIEDILGYKYYNDKNKQHIVLQSPVIELDKLNNIDKINAIKNYNKIVEYKNNNIQSNAQYKQHIVLQSPIIQLDRKKELIHIVDIIDDNIKRNIKVGWDVRLKASYGGNSSSGE